MERLNGKIRRKIVLSDGEEYYGYGFGEKCDRVCEIVFSTAMVGYQEILTDPSCTAQMVVMTYPLIGNYGITDDDYETKLPTIGALVVHEVNDNPSNFRYTKTLSEFLEDNHIPGIYGVDTREITRSIRDKGSRKAIICDAEMPKDQAIEIINATEIPQNLVESVSCKKRWYSRTSNPQFNVVAIDCGIKLSLVRALNSLGCNVTVVPYKTSVEEIMKMHPTGIIISNGPGDPSAVVPVIELVKTLRGKVPMFGIGLGHHIIALAYGAKTEKMKVGHHGGNHPIKNLKTGKIEVASQGHGFVVNKESLESTELTLTHINLLDGTVEGCECEKDKVFSVQFNPEGAPGPKDRQNIFEEFIKLMNEVKQSAKEN